jgi:hypothetical protein
MNVIGGRKIVVPVNRTGFIALRVRPMGSESNEVSHGGRTDWEIRRRGPEAEGIYFQPTEGQKGLIPGTFIFKEMPGGDEKT